MSTLATLWSLLSIPVGMFCLFLAWRIPFQDKKTDDEDTETEGRLSLTDEQLMRHFSDEPDEPLEQKRNIHFAVLFSGLGIGAILVGLEIVHPYFVYAGKFIFLLTIVLSFIVPLHLAKDDEDNLIDENLIDDNFDDDLDGKN